MLDFNGILKIYNDLDGELSKLKDVSNLSNGGYFESLLSNIDWHTYFLYRIKDKDYIDYFLLDKEFWAEVINQDIIKNNEISLKQYDYKKGFELFDKLKNNDVFLKYFNNYKVRQIEKITNKQEILSFSQTIKILHKLKEYKTNLKIDFFNLDIDDYNIFSKSTFNNDKSIISDYLRKSAIYDFDFEKFYLNKREELDKKILLVEENDGNLNDSYHDLGILNTYYRFYKLYNSLVSLSYTKIILLKMLNAGNMFDENKKFLLSLLIFHFSKNKQEVRKIGFIFKNNFIEFIILISLFLILGFGNIYGLILIVGAFIFIFIITKLIVYLIDNFNFNNLLKVIFSVAILGYAIFNFFVNPITTIFMSALPQKGAINIVFQDKKIKKEDVEKQIREKIVALYKQLNTKDFQSNILNNSGK